MCPPLSSPWPRVSVVRIGPIFFLFATRLGMEFFPTSILIEAQATTPPSCPLVRTCNPYSPPPLSHPFLVSFPPTNSFPSINLAHFSFPHNFPVHVTQRILAFSSSNAQVSPFSPACSVKKTPTALLLQQPFSYQKGRHSSRFTDGYPEDRGSFNFS